MGVYIGGGKDYSAMQGPSPTGYHVPSRDEWVALCSILTTTFSLASNATTVGTYLKMPMAGYRNGSSAGVNGQGTHGYYWSSSAYSVGNAYSLYFHSTALNPQNGFSRAYGFTVRCFKDSPVIPDSSWTTLYQGSGSAGIFRNSSLGLISVSGDGTTWYTIMDKNLGATSTDITSTDSYGYYYQWGNNYGFATTGTVTTSSTKVDASSYGPGNYYNSSTFITVSESPYDWSSVQNDDLWGGVTGVSLAPLQNAYIGEYEEPVVVNRTFAYTGSDQTWTVPATQSYKITAKGAGSNTAAGGLGQGTISLTKGTVLTIMVGQSGSSTSSATYGFGGSSNYSNNRAGGGLSGVFTGGDAITATSASRALVIGGGAGGGQSSSRAGGMGGGESGQDGQGSNYGTAGGGGTQSGRNSGGNVGANQFNGGNGSGTYGWGGGGGWYGGNGSKGDSSGDDDKGAGGGSGYVISTASDRVLTQGGGAASGSNGSVTIESV